MTEKDSLDGLEGGKPSRLKMAYFDGTYKTLAALGSQDAEDVTLVMHTGSRKIYVKKRIALEAVTVHNRLKNLVHPNIAVIYDVVYDENGGIVIEEFVNGITLAEYIERENTLREDEVCKIISSLCDALEQIHAMGIVHRDIKPENIMVSNDGVWKLIDFGIARTVKNERAQDTTILGTEGYAAPEQFGYTQTDERTDIYALGVLMNKLLTGRMPTQGIYEVQPLRDIIQRCIKIDAQNRFQSVRELREAIHGEKEQKGLVIKGIPGFRTGVVWKNVIATSIYAFMILVTCVMASTYTSSIEAFLLGTLSVCIYLWAVFIVCFNVGDWDRKIYPFRILPKPVMVVIRIALAFAVLYWGMLLDEYVRYSIMGLTRTK